MLEDKPQVLMARVLLRTLEKIAAGDSDQEWVELYNKLKPICESRLRERSLGGDRAKG